MSQRSPLPESPSPHLVSALTEPQFPCLWAWPPLRPSQPFPTTAARDPPRPTHPDEARGEARERDVGPGGLGVGTAIPEPADVREAVAVGAERQGRDQGHRAHGQREAPVESPHLADGWVGPKGPSQTRGGPGRWPRLTLQALPGCGTPGKSPAAQGLGIPGCKTGITVST